QPVLQGLGPFQAQDNPCGSFLLPAGKIPGTLYPDWPVRGGLILSFPRIKKFVNPMIRIFAFFRTNSQHLQVNTCLAQAGKIKVPPGTVTEKTSPFFLCLNNSIGMSVNYQPI